MIDDFDFEPKPASFPCLAKKHTFEQVDCIRLRVERGEELFHPSDEREAEYDPEVLRASYKMLVKAKDVFVAERKAAEKAEREAKRKLKPPPKPRKAMIAKAPKRRAARLDTASMQK